MVVNTLFEFQRFFCEVDVRKLGFYTFHIFLSIDENFPEKEKELHKYLADHRNVFSVIEYSDRWDLEIGLIARNLLEFDEIIMDISERFADLILEKDKLEIIKKYNENYVPILIKEKKQDLIPIKDHKIEEGEIDELDLHLLKVLAEDCRLSTYEIGSRLKINADTVSYRIKRLVKQGIIRKFTLQVNYSLMKYHWYTFSVETKMFDKKSEKAFLVFLEDNKSIMRSAKTLGGWDILLYILVENPGEFHRMVKDIKMTFAPIVRNYQTWIAFKEYLFNPFPFVIETAIKKN